VKPPNGIRDRNTSAATQTVAAHTGQTGSRETAAIPAPATATNSACSTESASHGVAPTYSPVHGSSGKKKPRPAR
jgi:hypothetical protein